MSVKMRVGGFYRQRNGKTEMIVYRTNHPNHCWIGKSGRAYTDKGRYHADYEVSPQDLIEELDPPSESVELTDEEIKSHEWMLSVDDAVYLNGDKHYFVDGVIDFARAVIAAYEAKRVSCSRAGEKLTHDAGRVNETGKREHDGGAA